MSSGDRLFATRWVHVFEEDTTEGAVYRPADAAIPLSRRPREQLELNPDGSGNVFNAGADDKLVNRPATWVKDGETTVIRTQDGEFRVVAQSPDRIVVKIRGTEAGE